MGKILSINLAKSTHKFETCTDISKYFDFEKNSFEVYVVRG